MATGSLVLNDFFFLLRTTVFIKTSTMLPRRQTHNICQKARLLFSNLYFEFRDYRKLVSSRFYCPTQEQLEWGHMTECKHHHKFCAPSLPSYSVIFQVIAMPCIFFWVGEKIEYSLVISIESETEHKTNGGSEISHWTRCL